MGRDNVYRQYYTGFCVNIISISYGAFCGWPSASFLELQSKDSPLKTGPMSNADVGSVGSMLCIGGLCGTLFFSWASEKIGRKRCLLMVAIPAMLGWGIIFFARNPLHLSISRLLGGFAGGGSFSVIPIYVTEFSEDRVRGKIGSFIVLTCNIGILFAFVLGYYCSYATVALVLSALPVVFFLLFMRLPETPSYLVKREKMEAAEKSLRYFRNMGDVSAKASEVFDMELEQLKATEKPQTDDDGRITWKDINNRIAKKALMIGIAILLLNQLCGAFAMINNTAAIFKESASNLSPNMSAIIVGIIQVIGSYVSTMLVERAGRKLLLLISAIGTGIGLMCLGGYSQLTVLGYDTHSFNWVPVFSFSFTIFIACWGLLPLPFVVVSEIMPPKIRNLGSMICMSLLWIFAFIMLRFYPTLSELFGMHVMMFFFAGNCFIGAVFVIICIPETKGKSIETILSML